MIFLCEHKTDIALFQDFGILLRLQIQLYTKGFQTICRTTLTGYASVTMFGYLIACCCNKDAELTANLLADPKENAEHVMLVDLARNDLSRNCHDVQVEFYKEYD